jgi:hypothetical protein
MKPTSQLAALVDKLPAPDHRGMYTEDIDKDQIERTIAEIHRGGRENIVGLIGMLVEPGQGDDVKAHYALHCLAVYVCRLEDKRHRREFAEALAAQLGGDRPKGVKAYLCQELQVAAGREACPALGKLLVDDDLSEPAAMALTAIGQGAAEQFRAALPAAKGRQRLTIIQNLGVLRDGASADAMKQALADEDREVRLAAGWGLANLGEPAAVELLLKAADSTTGWERIQSTKNCLVLAEKLSATGKKLEAKRVYSHLKETRTGQSERYIREAAEKALGS